MRGDRGRAGLREQSARTFPPSRLVVTLLEGSSVGRPRLPSPPPGPPLKCLAWAARGGGGGEARGDGGEGERYGGGQRTTPLCAHARMHTCPGRERGMVRERKLPGEPGSPNPPRPGTSLEIQQLGGEVGEGGERVRPRGARIRNTQPHATHTHARALRLPAPAHAPTPNILPSTVRPTPPPPGTWKWAGGGETQSRWFEK